MEKRKGQETGTKPENPEKRRLKTVQIGNFKVQIDPKNSLMATPRGDLVRRFKRVQAGMGSSRLPLASFDEDRPRRPIDPSLDTSRFISRERLDRAFEGRLGLRRGSVSSSPPRSLREPPKAIREASSSFDDDDDDDNT